MLLFSQKRPVAPVVMELEYEDGERQGQRESIGEDDREGTDEDAVKEPEKDPEREDKEHDERDLVRAFEAVDADELRHERDGGAAGGDGANEIHHPRGELPDDHVHQSALRWRKK